MHRCSSYVRVANPLLPWHHGPGYRERRCSWHPNWPLAPAVPENMINLVDQCLLSITWRKCSCLSSLAMTITAVWLGYQIRVVTSDLEWILRISAVKFRCRVKTSVRARAKATKQCGTAFEIASGALYTPQQMASCIEIGGYHFRSICKTMHLGRVEFS